MKHGKVSLGCIEQGVMNQDYAGLRSFRLEVGGHATECINEINFLVPEEMFETLYQLFDGKEVDKRCVFGSPVIPYRED